MPEPKANENENLEVLVGPSRSLRLTTGVANLIAALGFGFGYQVSPDGLMLAEKTLENFFDVRLGFYSMIRDWIKRAQNAEPKYSPFTTHNTTSSTSQN